MGMTRGEFLRSVAVGAGSAIAGITGLNRADAQTAERGLGVASELTEADFAKHLKSKFRVADRTSPAVIDAELVEVKTGSSSERHEQFSCLFHGPAEPQLSQQTYDVEHPAMGRLELFLVPVGADEKGVSYEAVFSRVLT